MGLDGRVDRLLVVDAIGDETVDFLIDLGQQVRHLRGILLMIISHARCHDLALVLGWPLARILPKSTQP
jgi:hypothetical protein